MPEDVADPAADLEAAIEAGADADAGSMAHPRCEVELDQIDPSAPWFWAQPWSDREGAFQKLRAERPISFHAELETPPLPVGPGYYALTRHADVLEASRRPETFCSGQGSNIADLPEPFREFFGSMINMDDPRHARLRGIVSKGFTRKALARVEADVVTTAADLVDEALDRGRFDFVKELAAALPLRIICQMMGIPDSEYEFVLDHTNVILGAGDPEYVEPGEDVVARLLTAGAELSQLVQELGEQRRREPTDDLTSALVNADVDGETLSDAELGSFFVLLAVAGNETTRNAIAHAMLAMTQHPEQRHWWTEDFDSRAPRAVEEIVRWATPVIHFRRTVTTDGARLGDQEFSEGDKVVLFYNSANRDEAVFDDPYRFDLSREPNPHVGFGGPGPHFCLGAHLARREITVLFKELLRRAPDMAAVAPPERLLSSFINGIKHLEVEVAPG